MSTLCISSSAILADSDVLTLSLWRGVCQIPAQCPFVFDVLCYFFYFSAVLFYIRIRSQRRTLTVWESIVFLALYICALNSKEMAVTLPAVLIVYEWLYRDFRGRLRWWVTQGRIVLIAMFQTICFAAGRSMGNDSLMRIPDYRAVFTYRQFMISSRNFINGVFFQEERQRLTALLIILIWVVMFVLAWALRSPALKFAWFFIVLTPLPMAFIYPSRGPAQYYLAYFGFVLYAATAFVLCVRSLKTNVQAIVFVIVAVLMYGLNSRIGWSEVSSVALEGELVRSVVEQVHDLRPALKKGSRVLFLNDPFYDYNRDQYRMLILMRLIYHDVDLNVDSARFMKAMPDAKEIAAYDYVFDYRRGRFYSSPQPETQGPEPAIVYDWGRPGLFHSDWTRVTERHPARREEAIISMATDLGDTNPPVAQGRPFPGDPLLEVAAPVEVDIDGERAEVVRKISWPNTVNQYRVDFRI
ncbi:MAG: hypothetical protein ABSH09_35145, partial [Bryobacteraceae bacterium]